MGVRDGPRREEAQTTGRARHAARSPHARAPEVSSSAQLLRVHCAEPRGAYPVLPRMAQGAWHHRAGRCDAASARTLSAPLVLLAQKERRAVELQLAARASCALA